jgi:hypothetical protein
MEDSDRLRRPFPTRGEPNRNFGGVLRNDSWASRDSVWIDRFANHAPDQTGTLDGNYPPEYNPRPDPVGDADAARNHNNGLSHNGTPLRDNVGDAVKTAYSVSDRHMQDGKRVAENQYGRRYDMRPNQRFYPPNRRQYDPRFDRIPMDPTAQVSRMIGELIPLTTGLLSSLSAAAYSSLLPLGLGSAYRMYHPAMNHGRCCERCGCYECRCSYCDRCGYSECRCRREGDDYSSADCNVDVKIHSHRSVRAVLENVRQCSSTIMVKELKAKDGNTLGIPQVIAANNTVTINVLIDDTVVSGCYEGALLDRKQNTSLGTLKVHVYDAPPPPPPPAVFPNVAAPQATPPIVPPAGNPPKNNNP